MSRLEWRRWVLGLLTVGGLIVSEALGAGEFRVGYSADSERRAPLLVRFEATIPAGYQVRWLFGDGQTAQGIAVQHTYYKPGTYAVQAQLLNARGVLVSYADMPLPIKSSGPEQPLLTILLGNGQVRLSAVESILYTPATPKLLLDGREIGSQTVPIKAGTHRAAVLATLQDGQQVLKQLDFTVAPWTGSSPFETEVLRLTNQARAQGWNCTALRTGGPALPPLKPYPALEEAALAQSASLALYGYFKHESNLDGSTPMRRVRATGFYPGAAAENIAAGQETPAEVVNGWLRSPGHCKNIMGDFTLIGVAYVQRSETELKHYWTQVFAKP